MFTGGPHSSLGTVNSATDLNCCCEKSMRSYLCIIGIGQKTHDRPAMALEAK